MSLSRRLRNIARSQIDALKERLDRVDAEAEAELVQRRADADARRELADSLDEGPPLRAPEQIARGSMPSSTGPSSMPSPPAASQTTSVPPTALARYYRVMGVTDGADLQEVEAAYDKLVTRCSAERFEEGSDDQRTAKDILARVEAAYNVLRDALDPTAGRFDKLEL